MAKSQQLQLRVSPGEKARIRDAAARAGVDMSEWVLSRLFPAEGERFRQLIDALRDTSEVSLTMAALIDFLDDIPADQFGVAVAAAPVGLTPYLGNYVAATVEHTAYLKGIAPPGWVSSVEPLDEPVFGVGLENLRLHLLTQSPPAFRRRNIFVDATVGDRV